MGSMEELRAESMSSEQRIEQHRECEGVGYNGTIRIVTTHVEGRGEVRIFRRPLSGFGCIATFFTTVCHPTPLYRMVQQRGQVSGPGPPLGR